MMRPPPLSGSLGPVILRNRSGVDRHYEGLGFADPGQQRLDLLHLWRKAAVEADHQ